jgi:hypothetical protein
LLSLACGGDAPAKNRTVDPFYIMDRIGHRGLMQDL